MEDFKCYEVFRYVKECDVWALVNQGPDITITYKFVPARMMFFRRLNLLIIFSMVANRSRKL